MAKVKFKYGWEWLWDKRYCFYGAENKDGKYTKQTMRDLYPLMGYTDNPEGTGTIYLQGQTYDIKKDTTFYPKWFIPKKKYVVSNPASMVNGVREFKEYDTLDQMGAGINEFFKKYNNSEVYNLQEYFASKKYTKGSLNCYTSNYNYFTVGEFFYVNASGEQEYILRTLEPSYSNELSRMLYYHSDLVIYKKLPANFKYLMYQM